MLAKAVLIAYLMGTYRVAYESALSMSEHVVCLGKNMTAQEVADEWPYYELDLDLVQAVINEATHV